MGSCFSTPSSSPSQESLVGYGEVPNSGLLSTKEGLLWKAIVEGKVDDVRQLLDLGVDVNVKFKYGWTPLLQAVQLDQEKIVVLLLERGADPLLKKDNGSTAFINAGIVGNITVLKVLLAKGADLNKSDGNGFTALMEAALSGKEKAVRFLLDRGADVNVERRASDEGKAKSTGGKTALMDAAKMGHSGIVRLLINNGANVNHQDLHSQSALHLALSNPGPNVKSVVNILLRHGAEVNMRDRNGKTALFLAVEKRNLRLVEALLERGGSEATTCDRTGTSALQVAVKNKDYEIVKLLLKKGASTKDKDLILNALNTYNPLFVKLLLKYGAVVESIEVPTNWTPVSRRWGEKLKKLHEMRRPLLGKLQIFINNEFKIHQTSTVGVYLGIYNEQEVAVKISLSSENERFLQEQRCLNYFQGRSHTMKLYGSQEDSTQKYMCLLLCEETIKELFNKPLTVINTKNILRDIFLALEDLHQASFAHQDVCPENILIDHRGKGYLADFDKSLRFQDSVVAVKRELIKGDMKGLANLVLFMVTRGQVACILEGQEVAQVVPETVENYAEARDLITELLTQNEDHQAVKAFFKHPFFWNPESKIKFLEAVGNDPDVKRSQTSQTSQKCELVDKLNSRDAVKGKLFQEWTLKIDKEVLEDMNKHNRKNPYQDTVTSLLKFIRNMGAHLQEKEKIRNIVKKPEEYFLGRFPDLTLHVYKTICCLEENRSFLDTFGFSLQL